MAFSFFLTTFAKPINNIIMIGGLGTTEIILILVFLLILFGAKKIPEFARGLGKAVREYRNAVDGMEQNVKRELNKVNEERKQELTSVNSIPEKETQE